MKRIIAITFLALAAPVAMAQAPAPNADDPTVQDPTTPTPGPGSGQGSGSTGSESTAPPANAPPPSPAPSSKPTESDFDDAKKAVADQIDGHKLPQMPATFALGLETGEIQRPTSASDAGAALLNSFNKDSTLKTGVAVEFAPFQIWYTNKFTAEDWIDDSRNNYLWGLLDSFAVSFATADGGVDDTGAKKPPLSSVGAKLDLYNSADLRRNSGYYGCVRTTLLSLHAEVFGKDHQPKPDEEDPVREDPDSLAYQLRELPKQETLLKNDLDEDKRKAASKKPLTSEQRKQLEKQLTDVSAKLTSLRDLQKKSKDLKDKLGDTNPAPDEKTKKDLQKEYDQVQSDLKKLLPDASHRANAKKAIEKCADERSGLIVQAAGAVLTAGEPAMATSKWAGGRAWLAMNYAYQSWDVTVEADYHDRKEDRARHDVFAGLRVDKTSEAPSKLSLGVEAFYAGTDLNVDADKKNKLGFGSSVDLKFESGLVLSVGVEGTSDFSKLDMLVLTKISFLLNGETKDFYTHVMGLP